MQLDGSYMSGFSRVAGVHVVVIVCQPGGWSTCGGIVCQPGGWRCKAHFLFHVDGGRFFLNNHSTQMKAEDPLKKLCYV